MIAHRLSAFALEAAISAVEACQCWCLRNFGRAASLRSSDLPNSIFFAEHNGALTILLLFCEHHAQCKGVFFFSQRKESERRALQFFPHDVLLNRKIKKPTDQCWAFFNLVAWGGIEPPTQGFSVPEFSHLSALNGIIEKRTNPY